MYYRQLLKVDDSNLSGLVRDSSSQKKHYQSRGLVQVSVDYADEAEQQHTKCSQADWQTQEVTVDAYAWSSLDQLNNHIEDG